MHRLPLHLVDTTGADATNDTPRYNPATNQLEYAPGGGSTPSGADAPAPTGDPAADTSALQTFIDNLSASGGGTGRIGAYHYVLAIAAGQRYCLSLPSNVTLEGCGSASHIELDPASTLTSGGIYHVIEIGNGSTGVTNVGISRLKVTANHSKVGSPTGAYVQGISARHDTVTTEHSDDVVIEHCSVFDANVGIGCCKNGDGGGQTDSGRMTSHFQRWSVRNCLVSTTTNKAIEFQETDDSEIVSNSCLNVHDGPQTISYCQHINIVGNHVTYNSSGINITEGSSHIRVAFNHVTALSGATVSTQGALAIRREPFTTACASEDIEVIGNYFDASAAGSSPNALAFQTRTGNGTTTWKSLRFTGNTFVGTVWLYDLTSQTASSASDIDFTGNLFESVLNTPTTWVSTEVRFTGNTLRTAHTINADGYRYTGNEFESGLTIAATADKTVLRGNRTSTLTDNGTNTTSDGNVVGGTYQPNTEAIRDTIGAALVDGSNITIVVDDAANTITISAQTAEQLVMDGTTPPEPLTTEDQTDFLFTG